MKKMYEKNKGKDKSPSPYLKKAGQPSEEGYPTLNSSKMLGPMLPLLNRRL